MHMCVGDIHFYTYSVCCSRQSQLNAEKCAADSNAKPDVKTPEIPTVDVKPILLEMKEKEEKVGVMCFSLCRLFRGWSYLCATLKD